MTISQDRKFACPPDLRRRSLLAVRALVALLFALAVCVPWCVALADNFANVYYDARKDQLVVTVFYRGTSPDHAFTLKWGQCKEPRDGGVREIDAEVLDSQWDDVASRDFKKTTKFSLQDLTCRPAEVTLRTAPRFVYTLKIPVRTAPAP